MAYSPALSPRPNPPGVPLSIQQKKHLAVPTKSRLKDLAASSPNKAPSSPANNTPAATTPVAGDLEMYGSEKLNEEVRDSFVSGKFLGSGTYANVYLGHHANDPTSFVAIKKMRIPSATDWKDGMQQDAYREIKCLQELKHPNIVELKAVFTTKDQTVSLVLEFLPLGDLEQMWMDKSILFSAADVKSWSLMICQAVWFCHANHILHRDIKGNNILISSSGALKLADFGLARKFANPDRKMSVNVITRFYRPPELLFGARHYGPKVDVWSTAVVIGDLALRRFFLPSDTDMAQLKVVLDVFGHPTEDQWPGVTNLEHYMPPANPNNIVATRGKPMAWWREQFALLGEDGVELLRAMLRMDPKKRLSSREVLEHRYWTNAPKPTRKEDLPRKGEKKPKPGQEAKRIAADQGEGRADKVARKLDFGSLRK